MKKKINVIDLDKTLLPYNSFTRFVLYFIRNWRLFFPILFLSFLRIIGLLSRSSFKKRFLLLIRKSLNYEKNLKDFSLMLYKDIKKNVMQFIQKNSDENTINILCTSSPEDYAIYLSKKIGWICLSSSLDNCSGFFNHLYGPNKITVLTQCFNPDLYFYNIAISDSKTDLNLLRLFDKAFIIKKNNLIELHKK